MLKRLIEAVTIDRPVAYWVERLEADGIPTGPIQNVAQAMEDPQILARNMVVSVLDKSGAPTYVAAGNPIKLSDMEDPATRAPAPLLDGDRETILDWLSQKEASQ